MDKNLALSQAESDEMIAVRKCLMSLLNRGRALLKITVINASSTMMRSFFVVSFIDRYTKDVAGFSAAYWPNIFYDFEVLKRTVGSFLGQYSISTAFFEGEKRYDATTIYELNSKAQCQRSCH